MMSRRKSHPSSLVSKITHKFLELSKRRSVVRVAGLALLLVILALGPRPTLIVKVEPTVAS